MSDSLLHLRRQLETIGTLGGVVRTMKALAASNIGQYEDAVQSLQHYTNSVELGLAAYLRRGNISTDLIEQGDGRKPRQILVLAIGSDQGMVGAFNQKLATRMEEYLKNHQLSIHLVCIGERMRDELGAKGYEIARHLPTPTTVEAITSACNDILLDYAALSPSPTGMSTAMAGMVAGYNQLEGGARYTPSVEQILPLEQAWHQRLRERTWPTSALPEIWGPQEECLQALVREYLFISLFRACAESLASENSARLAAMQRAEKNIDEQREELQGLYHRKRQDNIDAELFDVTYSLSGEG
ncbi:MAG: F0F1 ATP synthase subunit gamma [Geobacteraceae bacterium]|nr:F0F1 ATP synthase subunit gamma [Geobacteraceae bacterium]